ncbi:MAG TPA: hypothetical protein VGG05_25165 [Pseudonocardiaceae bacterium]
MPAVDDAALPDDALTEAADGLAEVAVEFADELGSAPTFAEFLEILGWSLPDSDLPTPLPLRAVMKGNKRYAGPGPSRVGELNDNVFEEARAALVPLFGVLKGSITPESFASVLLRMVNGGRIGFADIDGADVRKVVADVPKKRVAKAEIGDVLAIPVSGGHRIGVVVAKNRFGSALGLFEGLSPTGRLTAQLRAAPRKYPVYTEESLVKNGTWQIVGHDDTLVELFPADPEIYHKPGAWPGIDTGEFGAAEPADGPLRLIDAAEAREVGLSDGTYRQTYPAAFLQKVLAERS